MSEGSSSLLSPPSERSHSPSSVGERDTKPLRDIVSTFPWESSDEKSARGGKEMMICTHKAPYPNCKDLVFERPCEWRRHMDKHERPFHCPHPDCSEVRGFTYQGGLVRHEREVHNKFGGPREVLNCPIPYCKRHTGAGFTRRENLNEHLRRLHRTSTMDAQREDGTQLAQGSNNPRKRKASRHDSGASLRLSSPRSAQTINAPMPVFAEDPYARKRAQRPDSLERDETTEEPDEPGDRRYKEDMPLEVERLRVANARKDREIGRLCDEVSRLKGAVLSLAGSRSSTWPLPGPQKHDHQTSMHSQQGME